MVEVSACDSAGQEFLHHQHKTPVFMSLDFVRLNFPPKPVALEHRRDRVFGRSVEALQRQGLGARKWLDGPIVFWDQSI
jgi:hypothetical protein